MLYTKWKDVITTEENEKKQGTKVLFVLRVISEANLFKRSVTVQQLLQNTRRQSLTILFHLSQESNYS